MIEIRSLNRYYGRFQALSDINIKINPGEIIGLVGHNGAGKTTLLKILTGLLLPSSGQIKINTRSIASQINKEPRLIGYLSENNPLYTDLSVIEFLFLVGRHYGLKGTALDKAVSSTLEKTALKDCADSTIGTLSQGYKQRVGIAQAILHMPKIIILDEPTNSLDPSQILDIRKLIRDIAENATVILSTHILQEVQALCSRVIMLEHGKLCVDQPIDENKGYLLVEINTPNADVKNILELIAPTIEDTDRRFLVRKLSSNTPTKVASALLDKGIAIKQITSAHNWIESLFDRQSNP